RGAEIFSGSNFDVQNFNNCGQNVNRGSCNAKGITLIALIITIVIMLILAGITINLTLGSNGIFQKAKLAKQNYELASAEEKLEMDLVTCQMGGTIEATMEEYLLGELDGLEMYNRFPYNPESDDVTASTIEAAVVVDGKVYCVYLDNYLDSSITNKIKVVLEEDDNVMMGDIVGAGNDLWLNTNIERQNISSITFQNNKIPPEFPEGNAIDITAKGHTEQSVLCWKVANGDKFDLYIGANGGVIAPINCDNLFNRMYGMTSTTNYDFGGNFDTINTINMHAMFNMTRNIQNIDISSFNTENVITMQAMFFQMDNLTSLTLGNIDTSKVVKMDSMFERCWVLENLDLGDNFDTSNVISMGNMFRECKVMTSLDLGNKFNTSNVTNMSSMFNSCMNLTELDLGKYFYSNNTTYMNYIFYNCNKLEKIYFGEFGVTRQDQIIAPQMFQLINVPCTIYVKNDDVEQWVDGLEKNGSTINTQIR
ncbi:MAG: BspA family leucine-rich repeat surface protein, partial [Clostridia bacterium]|nr:BspA family leucine-rich repeat surface protein [Clostridia bacterium]